MRYYQQNCPKGKHKPNVNNARKDSKQVLVQFFRISVGKHNVGINPIYYGVSIFFLSSQRPPQAVNTIDSETNGPAVQTLTALQTLLSASVHCVRDQVYQMSIVLFVLQQKHCGRPTNVRNCKRGDLFHLVSFKNGHALNWCLLLGKSLKPPHVQSHTVIKVASIVATCLWRFSFHQIAFIFVCVCWPCVDFKLPKRLWHHHVEEWACINVWNVYCSDIVEFLSIYMQGCQCPRTQTVSWLRYGFQNI